VVTSLLGACSWLLFFVHIIPSATKPKYYSTRFHRRSDIRHPPPKPPPERSTEGYGRARPHHVGTPHGITTRSRRWRWW
jgi:hypothetical protein